MTTFHEVRLPTNISLGASGGPMFKTTIMELGSGFEKRNIDWSKTRAQYDIGMVPRTRADTDTLIAFFYAREGKAYGFRFKDNADYKIIAQSIGVGDGANTLFQAFKSYTSGGITYLRVINKIVAATYSVTVAGTPIVEGSGAGKFTIDTTTGLITFGTAPASMAAVAFTCEFDVPVRFDTDSLGLSVLQAPSYTGTVIEWPSIPLVELRQ